MVQVFSVAGFRYRYPDPCPLGGDSQYRGQRDGWWVSHIGVPSRRYSQPPNLMAENQ